MRSESVYSPEIIEGLEEWQATPESRDGKHPELREEFHLERTPEPLTEKKFLGAVVDYCRERREDLLHVGIDKYHQPEFNEALMWLDIDPEAVDELGLGLTIRNAKLTTEPRLFIKDAHHPHGRLAVEEGVMLNENELDIPHLLALDFLSRTMRRDTAEGKTRYFFRPEGRYLARNDRYGGDGPAELRQIYSSTVEHFQDITNNLSTFAVPVVGELVLEAEAASTIYDRTDIREVIVQKAIEKLDSSPQTEELLFTGISAKRLLCALENNDEQLAERLTKKGGWLSHKPLYDYGFCNRMASDAGQTFMYDLIMARAGGPYQEGLFVGWSRPLRRPVIYDPIRDDLRYEIRRAAETATVNYLAKCAAESLPDIKPVFERFANPGNRSARQELFGLMYRLGSERATALFEDCDAALEQELLQGYHIVRRTSFEIEDQPLSDLKRQLREASELVTSGIWPLVNKTPELVRYYEQYGNDPQGLLDSADELSELYLDAYERGQLLLARAKQILLLGRPEDYPSGVPGDVRVPNANWECLDYDLPNLPDEEILRCLGANPAMATYLIKDHRKLFHPDTKSMDADKTRAARSLVIEALVKAVRQGYDPRVYVLVNDKQAHLERLLGGKIGEQVGETWSIMDDSEHNRHLYTLENGKPVDLKHSDLPEVLVTELRNALFELPEGSPEQLHGTESRLMFERASAIRKEFGDYPLGLLTEWRSTRDPSWEGLLPNPVTSHVELVTELMIAEAKPEHQELARQAIAKIGVGPARVLMKAATPWVPDGEAFLELCFSWASVETTLPPEALRSIVLSIHTSKELSRFKQLLPMYDQAKDPLFDTLGVPTSIAMLESSLSAHPKLIAETMEVLGDQPGWQQALRAPGFNFGKLQEFILTSPEFRRFLKPERNDPQPFQPCCKYFLNEELHLSVADALGALSKRVPGRAARPKKLYHDLKQLLRERKSELSVVDLTQSEIPIDLHEDIIAILERHEREPGELIEAMIGQIHHKADPAGWVSGNYTDCCIPFGRSLNNDYMINPTTQYFTVSHRGQIIAQSVVVDARDRKTGQRVAVLDSVEIAKPYREVYRGKIEDIYKRFWKRFYPQRPLKVGAMNGDPKLGGTLDDASRYQPVAPLDYTDAWRFEMYHVAGPNGTVEWPEPCHRKPWP